MPIVANFYITIDQRLHGTISARLNQLGLKIDSKGLVDTDTRIEDPSHIMILQQKYPNANSIAILERINQLYGIEGIKCVQPLYTREDEPEIKPKKRGYFIGWALGTVFNLISVLQVIVQIKPNATSTDFLMGGIVPVLVGAANTIYIKFFQ